MRKRCKERRKRVDLKPTNTEIVPEEADDVGGRQKDGGKRDGKEGGDGDDTETGNFENPNLEGDKGKEGGTPADEEGTLLDIGGEPQVYIEGATPMVEVRGQPLRSLRMLRRCSRLMYRSPTWRGSI